MKKILLIISIILCGVSSSYALTAAIQACIGVNSASCSASYGSDLATSTNCTDSGYYFAQSPDADADATTGWDNSGAATFESVETGTPQQGSSHLYALSDTGGDHFYRDFSGLSASTLYRLSIYAKHDGSGGNWQCTIGASHFSPTNAVTPAITSSDTTYTNYKRYFYYTTDVFATFQCRSASTDGGFYLDTFSITTATLCLGSQLHIDGNAASLTNEADSIGNWATAATATFDSVETDPQDGTSSLHMVANAAGGRISLDLSGILTVGKKYFISWKVKTAAGDNSVCGLGGSEGSTDTMSAPTSSSWTNPGLDFTYATASHRYFSCRENGANNNSEILFDSLSIKEITSE